MQYQVMPLFYAASENFKNTIRFSIEFAEDVAPDALFHAVREVQARYPYYLSMLKKH